MRLAVRTRTAECASLTVPDLIPATTCDSIESPPIATTFRLLVALPATYVATDAPASSHSCPAIRQPIPANADFWKVEHEAGSVSIASKGKATRASAVAVERTGIDSFDATNFKSLTIVLRRPRFRFGLLGRERAAGRRRKHRSSAMQGDGSRGHGCRQRPYITAADRPSSSRTSPLPTRRYRGRVFER